MPILWLPILQYACLSTQRLTLPASLHHSVTNPVEHPCPPRAEDPRICKARMGVGPSLLQRGHRLRLLLDIALLDLSSPQQYRASTLGNDGYSSSEARGEGGILSTIAAVQARDSCTPLLLLLLACASKRLAVVLYVVLVAHRIQP